MAREDVDVELTIFGGGVEIDTDAVDAAPETIRRQVREYERGERRAFDLEAEPPTPFVGRVMDAMAAIPHGETHTYGDLAADLDTAPVAVGRACGRNPAPIVVPCHRVVGSDGGLHGYSAPGGLELKRRLLEHEGAGVQTRLDAP
jgi:methylated-DNA-[protein]-cysteine S-methyltransferase